MEKSGLFLALLDHFSELSGLPAYFTILGVLLACGLGLPIPEDITLIAAGILAGTGQISIAGAYIAGYIGVLLGDTILFFLGRHYGRKVFTWPLFRRLFTPERVLAAQTRVQKNARLVCFVARFLPGVRAPIYLTAGVLHVNPLTFILQDGLAALISVPIWVYIGHWAGENLDLALKKAKDFNLIILGVVLLVIVFFIIRHYYQKNRTKSAAASVSSNDPKNTLS